MDIERLKTDAAYWDDLKAPEDATHACIYLGGKWQWMKVNLSGPFNYYWHKRSPEWRRQESEVGERIIPRPTKPAAPEWDGEEPDAYMCPAGCGCLWRDNGDDTMSLYGPRSQSCDVCEPLPLYRLIPVKKLRTKEQRERDDLEQLLFDQGVMNGHCAGAAAAIIAAGYRKEKQDD